MRDDEPHLLTRTLAADAHDEKTAFASADLKADIKAVKPGSSTASETDGSSDDEHAKLMFSDEDTDSNPREEPPTKTLRDMCEPRFWSLVTLAALAASAPLVLVCTFFTVALHRLFEKPTTVAPNGKVAIVSGGKMTKSFVMIKQLKKLGCRVVLVETSKYWMVASRFSKCVDRFVTVPVPEKETDAYLAAMAALAEEEGADLFVPVTSPVASQYEAQLERVLPEKCYSWSLSHEETVLLDDKVVFCQAAEALGLPAPASHRVCSHAEAHAFNDRLRDEAAREPTAKHAKYIFKNLQYDSMHRLDLFTLPCAPAKLAAYLDTIEIDEANPWTAQTFIVGDEYSSCAIVKDGNLLSFVANEASISCFNYSPERNPRLRQWVQTFCEARRLSGVICIDFIVEADGTPYAIECNPRFSSNITCFYNSSALGEVCVDPHAPFTGTKEPLASCVETYWLFSEVWAALTKPGLLRDAPARARALLHTVRHKKDAYFDAHDPLPFLAHCFVHIPTLLLRNVCNGNRWAKIDPCIGKMTEENGD